MRAEFYNLINEIKASAELCGGLFDYDNSEQTAGRTGRF